MAVVFDNNVLVSAAFFATSKPALAVRWAAENDLILASAATLAASLSKRREFVAFVSATAHFVNVRRSVQACRDPKDDKFLDVAVNGGANIVVTGDADLLVLGSFEKTPIMTPAEYLASFGV